MARGELFAHAADVGLPCTILQARTPSRQFRDSDVLLFPALFPAGIRLHLFTRGYTAADAILPDRTLVLVRCPAVLGPAPRGHKVGPTYHGPVGGYPN